MAQARRRFRAGESRGLGPDFGRLWAGQSVSVFGTLVGRFALSLVAVVMLRATAGDLALLRVAEVVPIIVAGIVVGAIVDRGSRRTAMIIADLGRFVVTLSVPALAMLGQLTMWWLVAVVALLGMFGLIFDVAYRAYLPAIVPLGRISEANARLETSNAAAEVAGFGIAGVLVQAITAPMAILVDAGSFLVSALSIMAIRYRESPPSDLDPVSGAWTGLIDGARWILRVRKLRALIGLEATHNLVTGGTFATLIMLFFVDDARLDAATMGLLFALGGLSAFVGATLTTRALARLGEATVLVGGYVVASLATLLVPLAGGPWWLALAMFAAQQLVGDGAMIAHEITRTSAIQSLTPARALGRVIAFFRLATQVSFLLGTGIAVLLADTLGVRGALLASAALGVVSAGWLIGWRDGPAPGHRADPASDSPAT